MKKALLDWGFWCQRFVIGFKILLDTLNSSGPCVIAGNFVSFFFLSVFFGHPIACHAKLKISFKSHVIINWQLLSLQKVTVTVPERSALINNRRKALGHLIKFTQCSIPYCVGLGLSTAFDSKLATDPLMYWSIDPGSFVGLGLILYVLKLFRYHPTILGGLVVSVVYLLGLLGRGFESCCPSCQFVFLSNWRDLHFHEHFQLEISSKCDIKVGNSSTLCKFHKVSKGLSTDVNECWLRKYIM